MSLVQNGIIASTPRCITLKILAAAGQFWLPHTRIPAGSKMTFTGMKAVPQSQPPRAGTISAFPLFHLLTPAFFFPKQTPFVPFSLPEHWQHGEKSKQQNVSVLHYRFLALYSRFLYLEEHIQSQTCY